MSKLRALYRTCWKWLEQIQMLFRSLFWTPTYWLKGLLRSQQFNQFQFGGSLTPNESERKCILRCNTVNRGFRRVGVVLQQAEIVIHCKKFKKRCPQKRKREASNIVRDIHPMRRNQTIWRMRPITRSYILGHTSNRSKTRRALLEWKIIANYSGANHSKTETRCAITSVRMSS